MVLLQWNTGDTITKIAANNKGIRKGTEAEIAAIIAQEREIGDMFFNTTNNVPQTQLDPTNDRRGNILVFIGADGQEASVTGTTPTQVKDLDFFTGTIGYSGNKLFVKARLKNSNAGSTAHLRVRKDGGGTDLLDLTTSSTTYVIVEGTIDISADAKGYKTLEFYLDSGAGDTATVQLIEVYGI